MERQRRQPRCRPSEHLTDHDGGHGGKEGDAEGGEWVLALGYGHGGDHAGAKAGYGELAGEFTGSVHAGFVGIAANLRRVEGAVCPRPDLRYGASGFFIARNMTGRREGGRRPGAAAARPALQGLQLLPGRA